MKPVFFLLLAGCLPDLSGTLDPGPPPSDEPPVVLEPTDTTDTGVPGLPVAAITMDATDLEQWVALDIDTFDPLADPQGTAWDLRFRRFEIVLNGGASGTGGVELVRLDGVPFDDVREAPDGPWVTDAPDADGDGVPELALVDWYLYDEDTHQLSPADRSYAVRSTEGTIHRLAFDAYYDENGTPARIALRIGPLTAAEN